MKNAVLYAVDYVGKECITSFPTRNQVCAAMPVIRNMSYLQKLNTKKVSEGEREEDDRNYRYCAALL